MMIESRQDKNVFCRDPKPQKPLLDPRELIQLVIENPEVGYEEYLKQNYEPELVRAGMKRGKVLILSSTAISAR